MAPTNSLDELRRRIGHGTTPVAFAALAEEHRRDGRLDEAVAVCREGLERYPTYASARVTLGRALLDLGDVQGAFSELEEAVAQAPDNLAAVRAFEVVRLRLDDEEAERAVRQASTEAPPALDQRSDDAMSPDAQAWLGPVTDEAADDPVYAPFASERPEVDVEPPSAVAPPWNEILPIQTDAEASFSWGPAPPSTRSASAFASWNASVQDSVADVFAEAAGEAPPPLAADATVPVDAPFDETPDDLTDDSTDNSSQISTAAPLDSLQTLLATIRARRALLAEPQSGVD